MTQGKRTPRLIGITGRAGAGKDTIGYHLRRNFGYKPVAFADPIRRALVAMLDIDEMHFSHAYKEQVLPQFGKSPRQLMQTLGTEWGRNLVNPDLWLIVARGSIEQHWSQSNRVVITDVRFENEANLIREMGGVVWHVLRAASGTQHAHASENGVSFQPDTDRMIDNNTSFEELFNQVDGALV